jgi:cold shock CspA family protein
MRQKVLDLSHQQAVVKTFLFRENDKVEFEVENGRKGLNAVNVKVI